MSATGREKVRTTGADGASAASSAGRTRTCGSGPGGNQLTLVPAGSRSHARGAPATSAVPALWAASAIGPIGTTRRGVAKVTRVCRPSAVWTATTATGRLNRTVTGAPAAG